MFFAKDDRFAALLFASAQEADCERECEKGFQSSKLPAATETHSIRRIRPESELHVQTVLVSERIAASTFCEACSARRVVYLLMSCLALSLSSSPLIASFWAPSGVTAKARLT